MIDLTGRCERSRAREESLDPKGSRKLINRESKRARVGVGRAGGWEGKGDARARELYSTLPRNDGLHRVFSSITSIHSRPPRNGATTRIEALCFWSLIGQVIVDPTRRPKSTLTAAGRGGQARAGGLSEREERQKMRKGEREIVRERDR